MKRFYQLSLLTILVSGITAVQPVIGQGTTQGSGSKDYKINWTVQPFDNQVFVENKGQFDTMVAGNKVLFGVKQGPMYAYFTPNGIVYRYDEYPKPDKDKAKAAAQNHDPDMDPPLPSITHVLSATWLGSSPSVTIKSDLEQNDYYTFAKGKKDGYKANAFKKITYENLYPGIDVEFVFPEGKGGFKYTVIVHPGANPNLVKLKYDGDKNMEVNDAGNILINSGWGGFMDYAPVSYYKEDNTPVKSSYDLKNGTESFNVDSLIATKTLMIDPWSINWTNIGPITSSSSYTGAYDVDYDFNGDVWVYGGWANFQLVKFNSLGVKQWTYTTNNAVNGGYYGDFSIDKFDGNAYLTQGFSGGGAVAEKVNYLGVLTGTAPAVSSLEEMWRIVFDPCTRTFPVGGGGFSNVQDCVLDTTMAASVPVNVLNALPGQDTHDMCFDAVDPTGQWAYTATAKSLVGDPTHFDNYVQQMNLPTLAPTNWNLSEGYTFVEVGSVTYVGPGTGEANGMNGMAASLNWLYLYDGATMKQLNKATGAIVNTAAVSGTSYQWGGLDVDDCDNIYAGNSTNIDIYNSALAQTGTIGPLTSTIYDVVLNSNFVTLYACGKGFLSSIAITPPNPPTITKVVTPSNCFCSGKAKATLMMCGNPDTVNVTYRWSNGQTTQTATNLCAVIDTVTISLPGCSPVVYKDTVKITGGATNLLIVRDSSAATCTVLGSASIAITGGTLPYTYLWSNGGTTSSVNVGAGNWCVTYADNSGCKDSLCITVPGSKLPNIVVSPTPDTVCLGTGVALKADSGVTYSWTPTIGLSCNTCANPTATPNITTTYTVTGTDANGCSNTASATVVVEQPPVITISPTSDTICANVTTNLTAAGVGVVSYQWAPSSAITGPTTNATITASPSVTTTYTVIGFDSHNCSSSATATVYIAQPPTINVSATRSSICMGNSVNLLANATNTTSPFTWQPGAMTGPNVSVTPTVTTTYTVTATSGCGTASATVTIHVNDIPDPKFSADLTSGCSPLCIQFRDKSSLSSGGLSQWRWNFGNGDSSNARNPIYCYPKTGTFNVDITVVSDSGCSATLKILNYINVYSNPVASFSLSPQPTNIMSPSIQFTDHSTDVYGITYWVWNFGEAGDTTSYLQNPTHSYNDTGSYCATLVVMNQHGCVDTTTNCLVIDPIYTLYIPDAFTPNGNGINETFMAKGNDVKSFEMYIFDRWGMQLFHSTDITDGWPGTVKGGSLVAQEDTYVYLINATDHKNVKHTYIGKVNLIK